MRYFKIIVWCCLTLLLSLLISCNSVVDKSDYQILADGFTDPPMSARPGAFWCWLNGDVTKASITHDLEEMKAKGMSRAEIWDVAAVNNPNGAYGNGPQFLGDESVGFIKHALSEGKRLGIKIGMIGSSGWNAGGSWVTPDWASKALYHSSIQVSGPGLIDSEIPFPEVPKECPRASSGKPVYYKEVALIAIPASSDKQIKDLNDLILLDKKFDGTKLHWEAPAGEWEIIHFVCTNTGQTLIVPSPKSNGLFIDFLDPEATQRHLKYILDRLGITPENADESGFSYIEFDSMELDPATPWTEKMPSIFNKDHGLNIISYLPVFAGWTLPEGNDQFLYDFNKTVSDQLILSHYKTGREFLARYGMELVAEAGGPGPPIWETCPVDALKALGNVSVPRGEFWIRHRNMFLIKEVASASHIYGLGLVDAESFTTWRRWKDAPHDLKKYVDRAFCEGLNTVTFHTFANTRPEHGLPGRTYHAGLDINPGTTWWEKSKPFMDYLARCSYLLRQGQFVADVVYYYGDKAPNFFPKFHDVPVRPRLEGLGAGYDFDLINTDVLLNRMEIVKDRFTLPDGMSYRLLVLPDRKDIPEEVIRKVKNWVRLGGKVLVEGAEQAQALGEGILTGMSIEEALKKLNVGSDFSSPSGKLDYIHRELGSIDLYFVRNKSELAVKETCRFRVKKGSPEIWNPVSGERAKIPATNEKNGSAEVTLELAPLASYFVVFTDRGVDSVPSYSSVNPEQALWHKNLTDAWTVRFPENWGAPPEVGFDSLYSWTDSDQSGVRYFSGTASYDHSITLQADQLKNGDEIYLDLGEVRDVAEIFVNGTSAGILWTKPFRSDVTSLLKNGENDIRIEITNMWINRLTGDMSVYPESRYCKTNQPDIVKDNWAGGGDETYHLQPAGLLGPVVLSCYSVQ